jgi:hypothetical protein
MRNYSNTTLTIRQLGEAIATKRRLVQELEAAIVEKRRKARVRDEHARDVLILSVLSAEWQGATEVSAKCGVNNGRIVQSFDRLHAAGRVELRHVRRSDYPSKKRVVARLIERKDVDQRK